MSYVAQILFVLSVICAASTRTVYNRRPVRQGLIFSQNYPAPGFYKPGRNAEYIQYYKKNSRLLDRRDVETYSKDGGSVASLEETYQPPNLDVLTRQIFKNKDELKSDEQEPPLVDEVQENKSLQGLNVDEEGIDKPIISSNTYFPMSFVSQSNSAISISNSFSTGKGASATSNATAYGSS